MIFDNTFVCVVTGNSYFIVKVLTLCIRQIEWEKTMDLSQKMHFSN